MPIISFASDVKLGTVNFWLGAFGILIVTAILHPIPKKFRRCLQTALIILFAVLFVTNIFLLYRFSVPLNIDMLQILLGTNFNEAKEFFADNVANFKVLGSLAAFIFLAAILTLWLKKFFATRTKERIRSFTIDLLIIFALPAIWAILFVLWLLINFFNAMVLNNTTPIFTINRTYELIKVAPTGDDSKIFAEMDKQLVSEKILVNESDIPWIIFILGESTDRNHMQLYGYNLPTTPNLLFRYERGEIFRFNDTIACANHTSLAMSQIFTFAEKSDPKDDWYLKANIFDIVRRAGYRTVWLSNQSPIGLWGNFDKYFSARCDEKFFVEAEDEIARQRSIDGALIPVLDKFLETSSDAKNFWLIHLYGTHEKFRERYPAEFEKFTADDEDKPDESWRQGTAEYDNAVLYNDFIVNEIIRRFEDKNAVLIYISDHGLEVFDGRDFAGHSIEQVGNVHMIEIPALVWTSEKFSERYPEKISALKSVVDRPYRTDFLIHALLDLMDIRTTSFDATKSVINEQFDSTQPRIYNGTPYTK